MNINIPSKGSSLLLSKTNTKINLLRDSSIL